MEEVCVPLEYASLRQSRRSSSYKWGLLLGGLVGAGAALLATPRSGAETREMLRDKGMELKEKAESAAEEARQRAEEIARTSAERATELKQRGQSFFETQKTTLQSTVEGIKEGVKTYQEGAPQETTSELAPAPPTGLVETSEM